MRKWGVSKQEKQKVELDASIAVLEEKDLCDKENGTPIDRKLAA
jgi:hypothetical protein